MLTKRQVILLLLAIGCSIGAFMVLRWSQRINQQIENPDFFQVTPSLGVSIPDTQSPSETGKIESTEFLVSDFEELFSGEALGDLYAGEENYGFITHPQSDDHNQ